MRYFKSAILVLTLVIWAVLLLKCTSDNSKPVTEESQRMSFAAALAVAPDSVKVTPSGDTIRYYHNTVTGTYTYPQVYSTVSAKGSVVPPDTIPIPPVDTTKPPTGQIYPLSFTPEEVANRFGTGFEQWHDRNDVNLGYTPVDVYYRFVATRIATSQRGVYNWSYFDGLLNAAKAKKQKFSFGIMTVYPEGTTNEGLINLDGGTAAYPAWLQGAMSGEWRSGKTWVPNYNDGTYLAWILELNRAINDHLYATGNSVLINEIDIRSYGSWGEWHSANLVDNVDQYPPGTFPTEASLQKIVDGYLQGFPNFQLSAMIAGFDAHWLKNTWNPPSIAYYLLTAKNNRGLIGWRRDQWGATDNYLTDYLKNNNRSYNGLTFKDSIVPRFRQAPVTGEPPAWNPDNYASLMSQAKDYNPTSIGNGNYGVQPPISSTISDRIRAVSKYIGYRLAPTGGQIQTGTGSIAVTLNWQNKGVSPTYEDWQVFIDFVDASGTVRKSAVSSFKPRRFTGTAQVKDVISTSGLTGSYTIKLRVSEPYRGNMPVEVKRNSDNTVTLKTGLIL